MTRAMSWALVAMTACAQAKEPRPPPPSTARPAPSGAAVSPPTEPGEAWQLETADYESTGGFFQLLPSGDGPPRIVHAPTGPATTLVLSRDVQGRWRARDLDAFGGLNEAAFAEAAGVLVGHGDDANGQAGVAAMAIGDGSWEIDRTRQYIDQLRSALNPAGALHVCWAGYVSQRVQGVTTAVPTGVGYAMLGKGGRRVERLDDHASGCAVAADARGAQVLVGDSKGELALFVIPAGGKVAPPQRLGSGTVPGLALAADGTPIVVASRKDLGLGVARGGGDLERIDDRSGYAPSVAVDGAGRIRIARVVTDGAGSLRALVHTSAPGGGAPWHTQDLGPAGGGQTALALGAGDAAFVAFQSSGRAVVLAANTPLACDAAPEVCGVAPELRSTMAVCGDSIVATPETDALAARAHRHCDVVVGRFAEARPALERGCVHEDAGACSLLGWLLSEKGKVAYATVELLVPPCAPGARCKMNRRSTIADPMSGRTPDPERAIAAFELGCRAGAAFACEAFAFAREKDDPAAAVASYLVACRAGRPVACAAALRLGIDDHDDATPSAELLAAARETLAKACDTGDSMACLDRAFLDERGLGAKPNLEEAARRYRVGCEVESPSDHACARVVELRGKAPRAVAGIDWAAVAAKLEPTCDGEPLACLSFVSMLDAGLGVARDRARAKELRAGVCEGNPNLCE